MTDKQYDLDELENLRRDSIVIEHYWAEAEDFEYWKSEIARGKYVKALVNAAPALFADLRRLEAENESLQATLKEALKEIARCIMSPPINPLSYSSDFSRRDLSPKGKKKP